LLKQNKPRTFWREVLQSYERTNWGWSSPPGAAAGTGAPAIRFEPDCPTLRTPRRVGS
jgi:hypothetical protein